MTQKRKEARYAVTPSVTKTPVVPSRWPTDNESRDRIAWRVGDAEFDGPWPWTALTAADAHRIHAFLAEIEKLTWGDACQGNRPRVKLERVQDAPQAVRERLVETKRDDVEHLVNLHIAGEERIWGVRRGNACHILWWDPCHQVWPSRRR
jgi:hypothetical protein